MTVAAATAGAGAAVTDRTAVGEVSVVTSRPWRCSAGSAASTAPGLRRAKATWGAVRGKETGADDVVIAGGFSADGGATIGATTGGMASGATGASLRTGAGSGAAAGRGSLSTARDAGSVVTLFRPGTTGCTGPSAGAGGSIVGRDVTNVGAGMTGGGVAVLVNRAVRMATIVGRGSSVTSAATVGGAGSVAGVGVSIGATGTTIGAKRTGVGAFGMVPGGAGAGSS